MNAFTKVSTWAHILSAVGAIASLAIPGYSGLLIGAAALANLVGVFNNGKTATVNQIVSAATTAIEDAANSIPSQPNVQPAVTDSTKKSKSK